MNSLGERQAENYNDPIVFMDDSGRNVNGGAKVRVSREPLRTVGALWRLDRQRIINLRLRAGTKTAAIFAPHFQFDSGIPTL
jgi:hypothetical protein